jgi:hypothetical protein
LTRMRSFGNDIKTTAGTSKNYFFTAASSSTSIANN